MRNYSRLLRVATPNGERIRANIVQMGDNVRIEVRPLEVVKKDDPPFAQNGVIRFQIPSSKYKDTIATLTQYLEDLFLKGMADEDIYTSLGAKPKRKRTKRSRKTREIEIDQGEGDTPSVYDRTRGDEQTESAGGGDSDSEVAESGDSDSEGEN